MFKLKPGSCIDLILTNSGMDRDDVLVVSALELSTFKKCTYAKKKFKKINLL